jgi:signal transduction histidine kinase
VVDDEGPIVAILCETLRTAGYEATGLTDPDAALAAASERFDLLVTDYKMPTADGFTLFEQLRARQPQLIGVLVTGFGSVELVQSAMRRGFSGILLKPFPLERIAATVDRALLQRRVTLDNERLSAILEVYAARESLSRPRHRNEVAALLPELALRAVAADQAAVLLTDPANGVLARPAGCKTPVPEWAAEWLGRHPAEASLRLSRPQPDAWRLTAPLECNREPEGLLLLAGHGPSPGAIDLESIGLLTQQAAMVLTNVRLFELRLREEKLALVGRMAGAICDRVRLPLAEIEAAVDQITVDPPDYADMIRDETRRLESLCAELSDLVVGSDRLDLRRLSLGGLLSGLLHRLEPDLSRRGIAMETELGAEIEMMLDEGKLTRALLNLFKNAAEAMPGGGRLTVRLAVVGQAAVIEIADTGCGMTPEVQARLFEPFFTHGKVHGTGLGGAIVHTAVTAHGGQVEVHSKVGEGTTFGLYLPLPAT